MDWQIWAAKYFGSAFGVLLSMLFVAPATSRNALYRILFAPIAGVIFSPAIQNLLWFLHGPGLEHHMAAACAAGFTCWFVLEYVARLMSSREWLQKLLDEILRLRGDKK
ncbi:MAG: hypothetical protein J0I48_13185 [Devosia sp.]|uniref:hypothetical protein n=1 Tax=Devosia sp. 66-22 TaxID=1895753 RepID=UPI00092A2FE6|nr:hypothetical protein [Devosia sp. 66-22]MBN9347132.1 hypothetical protein [Devosia sp.]OJX50580.1 MAG: hypothetical protein BGO81_20205 [Devosia sp. 66-22]